MTDDNVDPLDFAEQALAELMPADPSEASPEDVGRLQAIVLGVARITGETADRMQQLQAEMAPLAARLARCQAANDRLKAVLGLVLVARGYAALADRIPPPSTTKD